MKLKKLAHRLSRLVEPIGLEDSLGAHRALGIDSFCSGSWLFLETMGFGTLPYVTFSYE